MEHEHDEEIEVRDAVVPTHTTTIIRERRGSGGAVFGLIVAAGLIGAGFLYVRSQDSEAIRDAAIANAAHQVGDSAQQAGEAVENAANKIAGE
jgi:hypothetical protein